MSCPFSPHHPEAFDPHHRLTTVAALLSADTRGIIQPADGERWFSRDLNELQGRGWAVVDRVRADRLFYYRVTEDGRDAAAGLTGWQFDGFDVWFQGELRLPAHVLR